MATSGRMETVSPVGKNSRFYVQWQLASQDITNNTSTVNWQAGLYTYNDLWYLNAVRIDGGNADAQGIPTGAWSNITSNGDHQLRSGTVTISHFAGGTRTFGAGINGWLYSYGNRSQSGVWDLPTIPRATQPSIPASFDVGTSVTISLPRASSSFTHLVEYSFNGQSGVIATAASTSVVWAVPTSLANTRPNNVSGTGMITVKTYNGSTLIGAKTASFTALIPDTSAFRPSITNLSVTEADPTVAGHFSMYIQGKSKLRVEFDSAGAYGSTISKHVAALFMFDAPNIIYYSGFGITTDPIATPGDGIVTAFPVDSRNRQSTITEGIAVASYTPPAVSTLTAIRTDSLGNPDDNGTYSLVTMTGSITALSNENTKTYTLKYKKRGDAIWIDVGVTPAVGYNLSTTQLLSGIGVDSAYDVRLDATDYFSTTSATASIPTAFTIMDFHSDGKGMSFGKVADTPNRLEIGPKLPLNIIAPSSTAADAGFMKLRRADDSLLAFIATGEGGTGLNIHMYDGTGWKGLVSISETGDIYSNGVKFSQDKVAFFARATTSQEITGSVFTKVTGLSTEVYDYGDGWDTSTSTYTAPMDGLYSFIGSIGISNDSTRLFASIYKNNNEYARSSNGLYTNYSNCARVVFEDLLTAGDTITLRAWRATTGLIVPTTIGGYGGVTLSGHLIFSV